jgi:hypothetical protein
MSTIAVNIDYKELNRWLKRGELEEFAKKHNRSRVSIWKHLNGKIVRPDLELLDEVSKIVIERQTLLINRMKQIKENSQLIKELRDTSK